MPYRRPISRAEKVSLSIADQNRPLVGQVPGGTLIVDQLHCAEDRRDRALNTGIQGLEPAVQIVRRRERFSADRDELDDAEEPKTYYGMILLGHDLQR